MDANKAQALRDIGFRILPTCGNCSSGVFSGYDWGVCDLFEYEHEKHTGKPRLLSIHISGGCPHFEPKKGLDEHLHGFSEFR